MKRLAYLGIGMLIGAVLVAAWGAAFVQSAKSDEGHHVVGSVRNLLRDEDSVGHNCTTSDAVNERGTAALDVSDLGSHPQVVIRDETGTIIAKTELLDGAMQADSARLCIRPFEVDNVPDRAFYQVQVGFRPSFVLTYDEFSANDWAPIIAIRN
jgi:hypothetical protein